MDLELEKIYDRQLEWKPSKSPFCVRNWDNDANTDADLAIYNSIIPDGQVSRL